MAEGTTTYSHVLQHSKRLQNKECRKVLWNCVPLSCISVLHINLCTEHIPPLRTTIVASRTLITQLEVGLDRTELMGCVSKIGAT
jgi:hypothetical protein